MKPKEQTFDSSDSYIGNLTDWILAITKIPFQNKPIFKTYSATKEMLEEKEERIRREGIETALFDEFSDKKAVFIAEILPIEGREDLDGIFATFNRNNEAFFEDMAYGHYKKYFEENGIEDCKTMTWQEAYDKLCELAKKEQGTIPKFSDLPM